MKIIANTKHLLSHLSALEHVIPKNPLIPILENFLIEVKKEVLKVTVSDIQITAITTLSIESKDEGIMAVPAKLFLDTLKELGEQVITLTYDEERHNLHVSFENKNGSADIATENPADFPSLPKVDNSTTLKLPSRHLKDAIYYTEHAIIQDELRPAMNGLCLNFAEKYTDFVATDGHRLVKYTREDLKNEVKQSIILSRKAVGLIKGWVSENEDENVELTFNTTNAILHVRNLEIYCRLIDERFPDYENVIPNDNNNVITLDRHETLRTLNRSVLYSNESTNQIKLNIKGSEIEVTAQDQEYSNKFSERLSCTHEGADIEIGFNAKFLIELFKVLKSEKIYLKLNDAEKATVLLPDDTADAKLDILVLVMPMSLTDAN